MSDRQAQGFEVRVTTQGDIEIVQNRYDGSDEEDVVLIHPAQVELLVKWLREAEVEIRDS